LLISLSRVHAGKLHEEALEQDKRNAQELVGLIVNNCDQNFIQKKCSRIKNFNCNVPFTIETPVSVVRMNASPLIAALCVDRAYTPRLIFEFKETQERPFDLPKTTTTFAQKVALIQMILNHPSTNPNFPEALDLETPFHATLRHCWYSDGFDETIKLLFSHPDIDFDAQNQHGTTLLMLAHQLVDDETIALLKKGGADETLTDFRGRSAQEYRPFFGIQQNPSFSQEGVTSRTDSPIFSNISHEEYDEQEGEI